MAETLETINVIQDLEDADIVRNKLNQLIQQYPILFNMILNRSMLNESIPSVTLATSNGINYTITDSRFTTIGNMTQVMITPTMTNTGDTMTLSFNGGTAYPIVDRHGLARKGLLINGVSTTLMLMNNKWIVTDPIDVFSNTSSATLSATESDNKYSVTIPGYTNTPNIVIPITFDKSNKLAGSTMIANGGTAYPLKKNGVAITAYQIHGNETMFVYYSDSAYHLFGVADSTESMALSTYAKANSISKIIAGMSVQEILSIITRMLDDRKVSEYGISWEPLSSFNESWNDMCYGNGLFVAVGSSKVMVSADNGKTWIKPAFSLGNNWVSVTYMPEVKRFIAVASSGTPRMMVSNDGYIWTYASVGFVLAWTNVTVGKVSGIETAIAICTDGSSGNHIATTTDGLTWTMLPYATYPLSSSVWGKCKYGKLNNTYGFLFTPSSNALTTAVSSYTVGVFTSDLKTYTNAIANFTVESSTTMNIVDACYYNDSFVLLSQTGSVFLVDGTLNGSNYNAIVSNLQLLADSGGHTWKALINKDGMYIAVANSGDEYRCRTSPDGYNWVNRKSPALLGWTALAAGPNHVLSISAAGATNNIIRTGKEVEPERFSGLLVSDAVGGSNLTYDNAIWSANRIATLLALKSDNNKPISYLIATTSNGIAYTVSNPGVTLVTGTQINVMIPSSNASTSPTLTYNNGSAIAIRQTPSNSNISIGLLTASYVYTLVFNGTYWMIISSYNPSMVAESTTGTGAAYILSNGNITTLSKGLLIPLKFNVANTTTTPTINYNNTGALQMKIDVREIFVGEIQSEDYGFISYNGSTWDLNLLTKRIKGIPLTGYSRPAQYVALTPLDYLNDALGKLETGLIARLERFSTKTTGQFYDGTTTPDNTTRLNYDGYLYANRFYGAVYNDYAEYRQTFETLIPGIIVTDDADGSVKMARKRCCKNPMTVSDTYGFAIGQTSENDVPIALSGRVLVYVKNKNKLKIGDVLCSNYDGTAIKMRFYERILFPERRLGVVSEIPNYSEWGSEGNKIDIDGRVWIYIK